MSLVARKGTIAVPLLVVLFISMVATATLFYYRYDNEMTSLKKTLAMTREIQITLQQTLGNAVKKNEEFAKALERESQRVAAFEVKIGQLSSAVSEKDAHIARLDGELKGTQADNTKLKGEVEQLGKEKRELTQQLASLQKIQDNLQKKIRRILTRTKVDLGEMVIKPSSLHGRVLKVNKKYNFAITDLGKNDGVTVGMRLMAYRGGNAIGEIQIEKVHDELSVAKAMFNWDGDELNVGDTVQGKE